MDDFNFYNSENDGYRGGFGDYSDPIPVSYTHLIKVGELLL